MVTHDCHGLRPKQLWPPPRLCPGPGGSPDLGDGGSNQAQVGAGMPVPRPRPMPAGWHRAACWAGMAFLIWAAMSRIAISWKSAASAAPPFASANSFAIVLYGNTAAAFRIACPPCGPRRRARCLRRRPDKLSSPDPGAGLARIARHA